MNSGDIAILGAGPAGCTVARLLAGHGYRVLLVQKPRRVYAIEGLSERALAGLRYAGCERALQQCLPVTRQAHWNGAAFGGNREWLTVRPAFDAALLDDVQAAGVTLLNGRAQRITRTADGWQIAYAGGAVQAGFLIDARGRAAPHGPDGQRGPATVALGRRWVWPTGTAAGSRLAAFQDGWVWCAIGPDGQGLLHIVVAAALPPRPQLAAFYAEKLATSAEAQDWLTGAQPVGEVLARYAHPQYNGDPLAPAYARVGDAAFALDPLSGNGVYTAVGTALALAAVVHTLHARPQDAAVAERFYRERIVDDFQRTCRIGRDFYRVETRWPEQPFWRERRIWPDDAPAHAPAGTGAAWIEQRPVNADGLITLKDVIVTPDQPRGVWQVAGVELVPLWRDLAANKVPSDPACRPALAWLAARTLRESPC